MKAIILAAGKGTRLQSVLRGKPKPLLEIRGESIIKRALDALSKAGIEETILAVGFEHVQIKEIVGEAYNEMKIKYRLNDKYNETGNMHSFYLALDKPEACIVLDGDVIFHSDAIKEILQSKEKDATLLSNLSGSGDEVKVFMVKKQIVSLGKDDPTHNPSEGIVSVNEHEDKAFEFVGISKFSQLFVEKMFELHRQNMKNGIFSEHCEYCACRTSAYIPWQGIVKENFLWCEIDTPEDIKRAENVLLKIIAD